MKKQKDRNNQVSFLFGAGADNQYGVGVGEMFIEQLLCSKYGKQRESLLDGESGKWNLIYPKSQKVFLQTICENIELAKKIFTEKVIHECKQYYEEKKGDYNQISDWCSEWYKIIVNKEKGEGNNNEIKEFFLKNSVFFDALDEKFNSLRNPTKSKNVLRVINSYLTVYIFMLYELYDIGDDFVWTYDNVVKLLQQPYNSEKIKENKMEESYYKIIRESGLNCNVATTNYTKLAEENTRKKVTYLHGKLTLFEDYERLMIYDCEEMKGQEQIRENSNHIIPFILIPSGVKPIICSKEIEEFNSFIEQLRYSNFLIIVGYKFNSEDNHINSIITEWMHKDNNRIIYFNYDNSMNWKRCRWIKNTEIVQLQEKEINKDNILKSHEKIIEIQINKTNSNANFKKIVNLLEDYK